MSLQRAQQEAMKYMGMENEEEEDLSKIYDQSTIHEGKISFYFFASSN